MDFEQTIFPGSAAETGRVKRAESTESKKEKLKALQAQLAAAAKEVELAHQELREGGSPDEIDRAHQREEELRRQIAELQ